MFIYINHKKGVTCLEKMRDTWTEKP